MFRILERGKKTTVNYSFFSLKDMIDFLVQLAFDDIYCCSMKVTAAKVKKIHLKL